jgi:hypothetical protein
MFPFEESSIFAYLACPGWAFEDPDANINDAADVSAMEPADLIVKLISSEPVIDEATRVDGPAEDPLRALTSRSRIRSITDAERALARKQIVHGRAGQGRALF